MRAGARLRLYAGRATAIVIASLALSVLYDFPLARVQLAVGAVLYVALLCWRPGAWLIVLPLALPLLQLSPWSGRLYADEFDILVLLTLATALWQGRYTAVLTGLHPGLRIVWILLLISYAVALVHGVMPIGALDANSTANYYSNLNGLRVAKGLLWALLLHPAWHFESTQSSKSASRRLAVGLALGAAGVVFVVLWEREVFYHLIVWSNKYAPIQALLDFSTKYRVTALFADMHTGGTAIDGYLVLVLPFVAAAFFQGRGKTEVAFNAMVFIGLLYAAVTTFSRGVYLGIGVATLATGLLLARAHSRSLQKLTQLGIVLAIGMVAVTAFVGFRSGGVFAVAYGLAGFVLGAAFVLSRGRLRHQVLVPSALVAAVALISFSTASISARDYAFQEVPAFVIAVFVISLSAWCGLYLSERLSRALAVRHTAAAVVATAAVIGMLTPSLFGYRMDARFASVKEDLLHRVDHWKTAVSVMDDDWRTVLFGQGVGRFPESYYWVEQKAQDVGGFRFETENGNQYLRFYGAHDVRLGQRLTLNPKTDYVLTLDVRTKDPTTLLYLRLCHRHLIHPYEWNPLCVQFKENVASTGGDWERRSFAFNSGRVGTWQNDLRAPLVFTLSNRREYALNNRPQTVLDMDNVSIVSVRGGELVANGDFSAGIDHWFAYYDFNHLPWHIKNIWVHVYFETGMVGLALFIAVLVGALWRTYSLANRDWLSAAAFVSLASFAAVGTFGTVIDSPRIAFLYYFVLLLASELRAGLQNRT